MRIADWRDWGRLDALTQDLRYAMRVVRRVPTFSVTACVILSAGIGLNLTFFHLLNVTLLRPLTVKEPATLIRLERRGISRVTRDVRGSGSSATTGVDPGAPKRARSARRRRPVSTSARSTSHASSERRSSRHSAGRRSWALDQLSGSPYWRTLPRYVSNQPSDSLTRSGRGMLWPVS